MNAVEEFQAAIESLTNLRSASSPGQWYVGRDVVTIAGTYPLAVTFEPGGGGDHPLVADMTDDFDDYLNSECSEQDTYLIVTLQHTIDAQLDLLRLARGFFGAGITGPESATAFGETVLSLARAINGAFS